MMLSESNTSLDHATNKLDSFLDSTQYEESGAAGQDDSIENVIKALKDCLVEYKEKSRDNHVVLEGLGCKINEFPKALRQELKDIFDDNEVFSFEGVWKKQPITINPLPVLQSLTVHEQAEELQRLKLQLDEFVTQLKYTNLNLKKKLELERSRAALIEKKANKKVIQAFVFKNKLENAQRELKVLHQVSETFEQPKYSYEEIKDMQEEIKRLNEEIGLTRTKLEKFNNLPLNEKEAAKQLTTVEQELKNVEYEIKKCINKSGL